MVRVGGGWDTLEHFISRHDPNKIGKILTCKYNISNTRTVFDHSLQWKLFHPVRAAILLVVVCKGN